MPHVSAHELGRIRFLLMWKKRNHNSGVLNRKKSAAPHLRQGGLQPVPHVSARKLGRIRYLLM